MYSNSTKLSLHNLLPIHSIYQALLDQYLQAQNALKLYSLQNPQIIQFLGQDLRKMKIIEGLPFSTKQEESLINPLPQELKRKQINEKGIQTSPSLLHKIIESSDDEQHTSSSVSSPGNNPERSGYRRNTMSQNYPGVVSCGIGKFVLVALSDPKQYHNIIKLIDKVIESEGVSGQYENASVADELKEYVKTKLEGRVTINRCKVNNKKDIAKVFAYQEGDLPVVKLVKKVLVAICEHFFEKDEFKEWVDSCKAKEESKVFLLENRMEIYRIFINPENYKPKFKNYLIPNRTQ